MVLAMAIAYAPFGFADSDFEIETGDGWAIRTAAYLWMANINGTQTVDGQEAELDVSFGEIAKVLDSPQRHTSKQ